jgi:hypothetical protein
VRVLADTNVFIRFCRRLPLPALVERKLADPQTERTLSPVSVIELFRLWQSGKVPDLPETWLELALPSWTHREVVSVVGLGAQRPRRPSSGCHRPNRERRTLAHGYSPQEVHGISPALLCQPSTVRGVSSFACGCAICGRRSLPLRSSNCDLRSSMFSRRVNNKGTEGAGALEGRSNGGSWKMEEDRRLKFRDRRSESEECINS